MAILIGLGLAMALLYFWLIGHWFARILVFLLLSVFFFFMFVATAHDTSDRAGVVILGLFGIPLAWPIADIPAYCCRRRVRAATR